MERIDWKSMIPRGEDVLLKINLTWDFLRPGVDTGPWVVEGLAGVLSEHAGRIYLGESSQVLVNATRALKRTGMAAVAERKGLVWHNFSDHEWVERDMDGIQFSIPEICTRMPVVSVPVVKTHYRTTISAALKNLYGCLNDGRHNYHYRLADFLTRVNEEIPVAFTLADGTVSLEGSGPKPGTPKRTDFLAISTDRVALDASLARLMGFDPECIETISRADGRVGSTNGIVETPLPPLEAVPSFRFLPARPNFVARVEKKLRGGRERRKGPASDGALMQVMKTGAKLWYNLAYYLLGQSREARRWVIESPYGAQWTGAPEADGSGQQQ